MLRALNGFLTDRQIEGRFMTLCFATWHRTRRRLRIANAGQEQPFLLHGGKCEKIRVEGFPLGIYDDATYDERSMILDPGDILVFHSDGIGDTQNSAREFFGHERIAKIIFDHREQRAGEIANEILERVDAYSGGRHAFDDRTLVVLKVQ